MKPPYYIDDLLPEIRDTDAALYLEADEATREVLDHFVALTLRQQDRYYAEASEPIRDAIDAMHRINGRFLLMAVAQTAEDLMAALAAREGKAA